MNNEQQTITNELKHTIKRQANANDQQAPKNKQRITIKKANNER